MLNIKYIINIEELAQATYDFVTHRPIIRLMQVCMSTSAIFVCLAFIFRIYIKYPSSWLDLISALFAIAWLLFYKAFHKRIIIRNLKKNLQPNLELDLQITEQQIHLFNNQNYDSTKLPWKKIRFIVKNQFGYIFPLTGLANAGKFIWLPQTSLDLAKNQELTSLLEKFQIKIVEI